MRRSFHNIILNVSPKFLAKEITPLFPKRLATWCAEEIHHHLFPAKPQCWRKQSLAPFQKSVLRVGEKSHECRDKPDSLLLRKRFVVSQSGRCKFGKLGIRGDELIPICEVLVNGLRGGGSDRVCVLPNLERNIDQRDHNGNRADDLSEIGQIVWTHGQRAPLHRSGLWLHRSSAQHFPNSDS